MLKFTKFKWNYFYDSIYFCTFALEKKKHMDSEIIFFESTIVSSKKARKENANQKGKEEKKMQYTERYYG